MAGINLPWLSESGTTDYVQYRRHFARFRSAGIDTVRVWAAPWEVPYGSTESMYIANRIRHFERLMEFAVLEEVALIVCLHSHVELLDRSVTREVRNPDWGWRKNPLSARNLGRLRRPTKFFEDTSLTEEIVDALTASNRSSRVLAGFDLFNEPDRVPGYSRSKVAIWARRLKDHVSTFAPHVLVILSAADPFEAFELAARSNLMLASVHFHGWPLVRPLRAIDAIVTEATRRNQQFLFTELSLNSQRPPVRRELLRWALLATYAGRAARSGYAFLWWWPEVSEIEGVDEILRECVAGVDLTDYHDPFGGEMASVNEDRVHRLGTLVRNLLRFRAWRRMVRQLMASYRWRTYWEFRRPF